MRPLDNLRYVLAGEEGEISSAKIRYCDHLQWLFAEKFPSASGYYCSRRVGNNLTRNKDEGLVMGNEPCFKADWFKCPLNL